MTNPDNVVRSFATETADRMDASLNEAMAEAKEILSQRVYANGVRGSATQLVAKIDEALGLVQKLRKAIHDDFGTPPEGGE